jgi:hypothetical protein
MKNEMTEVKNNEMIVSSMFEDDAGCGTEGADKACYAIPFISLLQGLSPQIETVDGAKPGLFINTITNELYKTVVVIPCAFQRRYLRWAPGRGGYKGEYNPMDVETGKVEGLENIKGKWLFPEGNQNPFDANGKPTVDNLNDTRNHFVLVLSISGAWQPAIISLSSTQIKRSKIWMSLIQGLEIKNAAGKPFNPPSFSHMYSITAEKERKNDHEWWGYKMSVLSPVDDAAVYMSAKAFNKSVLSGSVEVSVPVDDTIVNSDGDVNQF